MTDVRQASDMKIGRLLRIIGPGGLQHPGTLSPDPWHFALWASSTVLGQGDAAMLTASPVPLNCCGARGACQQSPILRSGIYRLPEISGSDKGAWDMGIALTIVPLAQSEKCRGFGGRAPKSPRAHADDIK